MQMQVDVTQECVVDFTVRSHRQHQSQPNRLKQDLKWQNLKFICILYLDLIIPSKLFRFSPQTS